MKKNEILNSYLKKNNIPEIIVKKININSFLTDNFAYNALRIGNSIGDLLDISIEIITLEEITKKYDLILDTTEHAELHTKGSEEKDLDSLVRAALIFENLKNNKKRYKETLRNITNYIREEVNEMITTK